MLHYIIILLLSYIIIIYQICITITEINTVTSSINITKIYIILSWIFQILQHLWKADYTSVTSNKQSCSHCIQYVKQLSANQSNFKIAKCRAEFNKWHGSTHTRKAVRPIKLMQGVPSFMIIAIGVISVDSSQQRSAQAMGADAHSDLFSQTIWHESDSSGALLALSETPTSATPLTNRWRSTERERKNTTITIESMTNYFLYGMQLSFTKRGLRGNIEPPACTIQYQ